MLRHNLNREFILSQLLDLAELPVLLSTEGLELAQEIANKMVDIFQTQHQVFILGLAPYGNIARDLADSFKDGLNIKHPPLPVTLLEPATGGKEPISGLLREVQEGDGLFLISGEHNQPAEALIKAGKEKTVFTFAFCSHPPLKAHRPDLLFYVPVANRPRVKELFLMLGHMICTLVEANLFGNSF
ncbi:MAG TPA: hypothetical protein VIL83_00345 [Capillibacterium sp.]